MRQPKHKPAPRKSCPDESANGYVSHTRLFEMIHNNVVTWNLSRLQAYVIADQQENVLKADGTEHKYALVHPLNGTFIAGMLTREGADELHARYSTPENVLCIVELVKT